MLLYLWQIVLLRLEFLKAPAKWLGISVISANDPAYDLVPKVSRPSQDLICLPYPPSLEISRSPVHTASDMDVACLHACFLHFTTCVPCFADTAAGGAASAICCSGLLPYQQGGC